MVRRVRTTSVVVLVAGAVLAALGAGMVAGLIRIGGSQTLPPEVGGEVPVTATDQISQPSNNSPAIVADPTDPRFVVVANRIDARDFSCALQVSGDGGRSWLPAQPVPTLPPGADKCYAPEVAFEPDGALHYLFVGLQGAGNEPMGAFLTTSTDRGRTFSPPRQVLDPLNFAVRMAIDPSVGERGRLHLVWLHASADPVLGGFAGGPNPIMAAYSDDGGHTFSTPVQVSDPGRARVVAPVLALGPQRQVHVAYYDLEDDARDYQGLEGPTWEGTWSVVAASSTDGGPFSNGTVIDEDIVPPERPMLIFTMPPPALAVDGQRVCGAWTDGRHGDPDVLLRCSEDGGGRWGELRRLNDDRVGTGTRQYLPRLAVAPNGRMDAVFLDRRLDANNASNDVFYTFSTDGGRTFATNRRLTTKSSHASIGAQYAGPAAEGQFELGGRLGLLSSASGVMAAWPDTRYSMRGTAQDIFAATVRFPTAGQPGWARVLGASLLAAGAIAVGAGVRRRRASRAPADGGEDAPKVPSRRRRPAVRWPVVAGVAVAGGALVLVATAPNSPPTPLPPQPEVVEVAIEEYRFVYEPPERAGRAVFRVLNAGQEGHRFGLFPLPEDMPPIDVQLRGDERRSIQSLVDVPMQETIAPGERLTVAVDLVPGRRYALLCLLNAPSGELYADLGLNAEFRAGGPGAAPPPELPPGPR